MSENLCKLRKIGGGNGLTFHNSTYYAGDRGATKSVSLSLPSGKYALVMSCAARTGGSFTMTFSEAGTNLINYTRNQTSTLIGTRVDIVTLTTTTTVTATAKLSTDYSSGYPEQIYFGALKM